MQPFLLQSVRVRVCVYSVSDLKGCLSLYNISPLMVNLLDTGA